MSTFGERLTDLMNKHQLNDRELAEIIECGHASVSNWRRDAYLPKPDMLKKLAETLDVSEKYLLVGEESDKEAPAEPEPVIEINGNLYKSKDDNDLEKIEEQERMERAQIIDMRISPFEGGVRYNKETKEQLEDIDICIKCLKYMNLSRERKIRVHRLLSGIRTDLECKVLFGEI